MRAVTCPRLSRRVLNPMTSVIVRGKQGDMTLRWGRVRAEAEAELCGSAHQPLRPPGVAKAGRMFCWTTCGCGVHGPADTSVSDVWPVEYKRINFGCVKLSAFWQFMTPRQPQKAHTPPRARCRDGTCRAVDLAFHKQGD